jgi:uncharacterized protein YceK
MDNTYYDRQGNPITMEQWCELGTDEYRTVGSDVIADWHVSTIWIGYNFAAGWTDDFILIFETMILPVDWSREDRRDSEIFPGYQERYSTEAAAQAGHDQAKAWLRQHLHLPESP